MKVLLINAPTSFEQIYGDWDLSSLDTYSPPLGILHIASYIRSHGHEPEILDLQVNPFDIGGVVDRILAREPDVVGISSMTINSTNASRIASELKKNGVSSPVVLGGAHASAVPIETLKRFHCVDYVVIGEGELTFLELLQAIEGRGDVSEIRGIGWRYKDGTIRINEQRPLIASLDTLPLPAWDLLDGFPKSYPHSIIETKRSPAASIMTSRGCPFHCTFCDHQIFGCRVRDFSAEYTIKMIRHLYEEYGIRDLMIFDDNFLINTKKLEAICHAIIRDRLEISWYCMGHAKTMKIERLKMIRKAGCWFIEIGIESGNDKILELIQKKTTKGEIQEAVSNAKLAGLKVKGNFIFGLPGETEETLDESIRFATEIPIDYFQQNFLTIWPGCELSLNPAHYGEFEPDWEKLAHQRITFVPRGLTKEILIGKSKEAFRRFYLRPRIIFGLLSSLTSIRGLKFSMIAFVAFLKTITRNKHNN